MIRTQVYLHKSQVQEIAILAKKRKSEKAKIIRALIQKGLEAEKNVLSKTLGEELLGLAEFGKKLKLKGPKDLSINHDKYLYEDE